MTPHPFPFEHPAAPTGKDYMMREDENARAIALLASAVGAATANISERLIALEQASAIDRALLTILNRKVRDLIESHGR